MKRKVFAFVFATLVILFFFSCQDRQENSSPSNGAISTSFQKTLANQSKLIGLKVTLRNRSYDDLNVAFCDYENEKNGDIIVKFNDKFIPSNIDSSSPKPFQEWILANSSYGSGTYQLIRDGKIIERPSRGRAWETVYTNFELVELDQDLTNNLVNMPAQVSSDQIEFDSGYDQLPEINLPAIFPPDPLGGIYYASTFPATIKIGNNYNQYSLVAIRCKKKSTRIERAEESVAPWLNFYEEYFSNKGFKIAHKELDLAMGPWVRSGLNLIKIAPGNDTINANVIVQTIDIEFGRSNNAWWKISYSENYSDQAEASRAIYELKNIAENPSLSDDQKREQTRVVQETYGQEVVTTFIRYFPIYDFNEHKIYTADSYLRKIGRDFGNNRNAPIDKDPVGSTMSIIFNPSQDNIMKKLGLNDR